METKTISEVYLDEQIQAVVADLLVLDPVSSDEQQLNLAGMDVLAFVGAQVVIPILTGFLGPVLYEKYGKIRTRKLAQEARDELKRTYPGAGDPVDQVLIENEVIESLVEEGIPLEHARLIVSNAIGRIKKSLA